MLYAYQTNDLQRWWEAKLAQAGDNKGRADTTRASVYQRWTVDLSANDNSREPGKWIGF